MESRIEGLERELRATQEKLAAAKDQLRLQNRRARQLVAACTSRAQEKEREMHMLRVLKDGQLQSIVRKLLHFESLLRQEQKKIVDIVHQKDAFIAQQARELDLLRQVIDLSSLPTSYSPLPPPDPFRMASLIFFLLTDFFRSFLDLIAEQSEIVDGRQQRRRRRRRR